MEVAPDLLGRTLVRALPDGSRLAGRIVEVEAYEPGDAASHGNRRMTDFNATMFGPPGRLYVYFTYGNHWMMNAVTRPRGDASAVLLRAIEPIDGIPIMEANRGRSLVTDLCSGPGKLTKALGVDKSLDGTDLVRGHEVWIEAGDPVAPDRDRGRASGSGSASGWTRTGASSSGGARSCRRGSRVRRAARDVAEPRP